MLSELLVFEKVKINDLWLKNNYDVCCIYVYLLDIYNSKWLLKSVD